MKTALWKDFLREIRKSFSRFISIFAIVFIGVGFFAGIKATAPDMKHSMDLYYDEYNLMDIRIMSTLGLTQEDIRAIGEMAGVSDVQPGYFTDVISIIDSTEFVFKVHSIPAGMLNDSFKDYINRFKITEGRYPGKSGECLIGDSPFINVGVDVGDTITVSSGKIQKITEGTLAVDQFNVVGKVQTPYYLSYEMGASEIGDGKVNSFIMIREEDFIIPVYTEALVTVKNAAPLNSYSKGYEELVSKVVTPLENLGLDRSSLRLEEIKKQATEALDKAKKEFNEQKQLFTDKMKKAETDLNQAEMALVQGESTLEIERKNFQQNYQQGVKQIAEGEKKLAQAESQYAAALKQYNDAMAEFGDDIENLKNATQQLTAQRSEGEKRIGELKQELENTDLTEEQRGYINELIGLYTQFINYADQGLKALTDVNNLSQVQVNVAKTQLASARKELDSQKAELARGKSQLAASKKQAEAKFAAAENQLKQGRIDYDAGKALYEKEKAEGQMKLDEGQEQIIRAENQIENLSKPQWYVLDRNSHYSYVDYGKTADRIDAIAKIFPVFFFMVASLVCLTTMTRMVDEQRSVIGAYKAIGYRNNTIALKYVLYAAIASLLGGVSGLYLGMKIFPKVIYQAWSMMYTLPPLETVQQVPLIVISILIGILVTTVSALGACYRELKETPALLMRQKAPKLGKKIFLEKIDWAWKHLSFSQKVTARNLLRYKNRFFMTIIGIAGCTALLLAGFGLNDSISQIVNKQFKEIFAYNLNLRYTILATEEDQTRVEKILQAHDNVKSYLTSSEFNASVRSGGNDDIGVKLIIPSDTKKLKGYITLRDRNSQRAISILSKGVIINEKLAKELNAGVGDTIEMDNGDGARRNVVITGITENYVFHYAYMSADYYKEIFRLKPKVNTLMIKLEKTSASAESQLGNLLIKDKGVASVEFYSAVAARFEDTVKILTNIVIVIIASAGLLAFVVLYNLTNINISERIREIATIKVLGFYNREVSAYVYRENIVISILGSIAGIFAGIILHRFIMISLEQDGIMYGYHIEPISFLYSFLITLGFVMLVNLFMYGRLKKIPMVESLKSVD